MDNPIYSALLLILFIVCFFGLAISAYLLSRNEKVYLLRKKAWDMCFKYADESIKRYGVYPNAMLQISHEATYDDMMKSFRPLTLDEWYPGLEKRLQGLLTYMDEKHGVVTSERNKSQ